MAKAATAWAANDGSSTAVADSGDLLLQSGSYLLLEDGVTKLRLEDVLMTPKEDTLWDAPAAKNDSAWSAFDGSSIITLANANGIRVGQDGTSLRLMQNGTDQRILNESVVTPKIPTKYDNL